jgi:hypothetical protein
MWVNQVNFGRVTDKNFRPGVQPRRPRMPSGISGASFMHSVKMCYVDSAVEHQPMVTEKSVNVNLCFVLFVEQISTPYPI